MSRNKIAQKALAEDKSGVTITFENGETLTVKLTDLSEDIVQQLALHGLSQKLGDSYSGETELPVAKGKAQAVADRLRAGDWRAVGEGGGGGRITDLATALATVTGKTLEEAVGVIENMTKEQKKELRKHPAINTETKRIAFERAQKAAKGEDSTSLAALIA
jgi:hypothetical protein